MRLTTFLSLSLLSLLVGCENFVDVDGYNFISHDSDSSLLADGADLTTQNTNPDSVANGDAANNIDSDTYLETADLTDTLIEIHEEQNTSSQSLDDSNSESENHSDVPPDSEFNVGVDNASSDVLPDVDSDTSTDFLSDTEFNDDFDMETSSDVPPDTALNNDSDTDSQLVDTLATDSDILCTDTPWQGQEYCDGIDNNGNGLVDEIFDFQSDPKHCGNCYLDCMSNGALWPAFQFQLPAHIRAAACINGKCEIGECESGYVDNPGTQLPDCENPDSGAIPESPDSPFEIDSDSELTSGLDTNFVSGNLPCPDYTYMGMEYCDSKDNNCNGLIDETFNFLSNPEHCGGCNQNCMYNSAAWPEFQYQLPAHMVTAACIQGKCVVSGCAPGYRDDPDSPYLDCSI